MKVSNMSPARAAEPQAEHKRAARAGHQDRACRSPDNLFRSTASALSTATPLSEAGGQAEQLAAEPPKDLVRLAIEAVLTEDAKLALLTTEVQSGTLSEADLLMAQHQLQDISTNKELLRSIVRAQQESLKRLINR